VRRDDGSSWPHCAPQPSATIDRAELGALRELQLIANGPPESGFPFPRLTPRGDAVLRAIARVR